MNAFYLAKQNFITVTVFDEDDRPSEKEEKDEAENAEFDVTEFGSDPYPYYRKV